LRAVGTSAEYTAAAASAKAPPIRAGQVKQRVESLSIRTFCVYLNRRYATVPFPTVKLSQFVAMLAGTHCGRCITLPVSLNSRSMAPRP
jgi:hypothetical protein